MPHHEPTGEGVVTWIRALVDGFLSPFTMIQHGGRFAEDAS